MFLKRIALKHGSLQRLFTQRNTSNRFSKKDLQKYKHTTFLQAITDLNQLHCKHTTFLQATTTLSQLHCYHDTFIPATTDVNQLNRNHVTFLYDTINANQFDEVTNLTTQ